MTEAAAAEQGGRVHSALALVTLLVFASFRSLSPPFTFRSRSTVSLSFRASTVLCCAVPCQAASAESTLFGRANSRRTASLPNGSKRYQALRYVSASCRLSVCRQRPRQPHRQPHRPRPSRRKCLRLGGLAWDGTRRDETLPLKKSELVVLLVVVVVVLKFLSKRFLL